MFSAEVTALGAITARCFGILVCLPIADGIQHIPRLFISILFAYALSHDVDSDLDWNLLRVGAEFLIGVLIATPLRFAAEASHMFGELIDTARGQTVSSVIDPLNGHQVSDMASIARLAVVALALRLGALEMCVQSLEHSYELFPLSNLSMWHTSMVEVLHRAVVLLQSTVSLASLWFVSYLAIDILAALLAKVMHGLSFTSSATIAKTCVTVFFLLKVVLDPQEIAEVLKRCVFQYASVRSSANQDLIVQHTKVEMNDSSFASAE